MKAWKKFLIMFMVLCSLGTAPVFAGMPVIDISMITEQIRGFVQNMKEWQAQLKQWRSEYDRLVKAARGIAKGDFVSIVSGIGAIGKQVSNWTALDWNWLTRAGAATADGAYSLLDLYNTPDEFVRHIDELVDTLEGNIAKKEAEHKKYGFQSIRNTESSQSLDNLDTGISQIFTSFDGMTDFIINMISSGADVFEDVASIWNDLVYITPVDYADKWEKKLVEAVDQLTQHKVSVDTADEAVEGLSSFVRTNRTELIKAKEELAKINREENPEAYNQGELKVQALEKAVADYEDMLNHVLEIQKKIKGIRSQQDKYVATHATRTTAKESARLNREINKAKESMGQLEKDSTYQALAGLTQQISAKDAEVYERMDASKRN